MNVAGYGPSLHSDHDSSHRDVVNCMDDGIPKAVHSSSRRQGQGKSVYQCCINPRSSVPSEQHHRSRSAVGNHHRYGAPAHNAQP